MNGADILTSAPGATARGMVVRVIGGIAVVIGEVTSAPGPGQTTTAAQSNVNAAVADTLLLAANANRINAVVFNDPAGTAGANLYISISGAASTVNFIYKVTPGGVAQLGGDLGWVGQIRGIWDAALGVARVTELTP